MSKRGAIPKAGPQTQSFRPADDCDRYPSDPGCSSPELGASSEPRYTAKPPGVYYENTEPDLDVRKEPISAFQNIDPMDIEFDTKMAYQSLSDFQNGRCEQVNKECKQSFASIRILFCISLFISLFAFLLALGGLGLASYNFLDSDHETAELVAPQESHTDMPVPEVMELRAQLNQSLATIDVLNAIVEELSQNLTRIKEENLATIADMSLYINNISDIVQELLANPPTPPTTENTTVSTPPPATKSKELALYANCTSSRLTLASCIVPMGLFTAPPSFASCDTRSVPWEVEDYYNLDLYCAVTSSNGEANPIITTLEVDEINNLVKCSCYVTVSSSDFQRQVVDCGIFATRCPNTYYFNLKA